MRVQPTWDGKSEKKDKVMLVATESSRQAALLVAPHDGPVWIQGRRGFAGISCDGDPSHAHCYWKLLSVNAGEKIKGELHRR